MGDGTPRVFIARHGQTEWSKSGRWTGKTDLSLTDAGETQVSSSARLLIGPSRLMDPEKLARVFVSPRLRAQQTFNLMFGDNCMDEKLLASGRVVTTNDLAEWDYGDYEGLKTKEILELREERGLEGKEWDHFRDGCENGESSGQVTVRCDRLVKEIRDLQKPYMHGEQACDVVLVWLRASIAHGHILRGFTRRWLGYNMDFPLSATLEAGGIGVLTYQHHNIDEPALQLGMALPSGHE